jgi:hypothetical protein
MNEAPKQICLTQGSSGISWYATAKEYTNELDIKYVRADLYDAKVKAAEAMAEAAKVVVDTSDTRLGQMTRLDETIKAVEDTL